MKMLAIFAAAFVVLLAVYVAATVPGPWFPSGARQLAYRDFAIARGVNLGRSGSGPGAAVTLYSVVTDARSSDYPVVAWQAQVPGDAEAYMLWRNDRDPAKVNSRRLSVVDGGIAPIVLGRDPDWIGRVRGVALAIREPLNPSMRITGVALDRGGIVSRAASVTGAWTLPEYWSTSSINTRSGGADTQDLPLSLLLVAALLVAAVVRFAWLRWKRGAAIGWPLSIAVAFVAAWIVLDAQWVSSLSRQVAHTRSEFGGKDWRARHEAAEDGDIFRFIERARAKLPAAPARVFMVADVEEQSGRGAYYLYPHNVLFDSFQNTLPKAAALRPGDYIVVYHSARVQYDGAQRRLRLQGGGDITADAILVEPDAGVFKVV